METLLQDVRYAARRLLKSPGFTAVAATVLALGIGANTAIFSLLNQVLLKFLPVRDPGQVVVVHFEGTTEGASNSDNNESVFSYPTYRDFRDRNQVFDGLIARASATVTGIFNDEAERLQAEIVSGNFFDVLGVRPVMGRLLTGTDDLTPGGHPVIVLSYGYWTRRFGASSAILNQSIRINGMPMTVVGVAPRSFRSVISGQTPDVYVSIAMKAQVTPWSNDLTDRRSSWLNMFGRLKTGVGRQQAEAALAPLYHTILEEELAEMNKASQRFRERYLANRLHLRPASQGINQLQQQWEKPLVVVMAMVGLVLLIACGNVASLLISRASGRRREIAVRLALGASRWALIRQLLVEGLLLSLAGGLLGLVLSVWTTEGLIALVPPDSLGGWLTAQVDFPLLAFAFVAAISTALLFALAPATAATRVEVVPALKDQGGTASKSQVRFRQILVTGQVALSLVLMVAAGLFVRSLTSLLRLNPGFRPQRLLVFAINPAVSGYKNPDAVALSERIDARLRALPGVASVAAAQLTPLGNNNMSTNITVEGYRAEEGEDTNCEVNLISPGYFRTLGVPLVAGREFTSADSALAPKVAIINETFAKHFFGGENPIGRHIAQGVGTVKPTIEIVGIVRDSKHSSLRERTARFYYLPYIQQPASQRVAFFVRTTRDDVALANEIRSVMREVDSKIPVVNLRWMQTQVEESVYVERLIALLASAFGALATLLATVGLYGVIATVTARRIVEIGIRMALGATKGNIVWLVMQEAGVLVLAGLALGVFGALMAGRLVESQLFGVQANDPLVIFGSAATLSAVALLAGYLPARRAARVDPMVALRYE